MTPSIPSAATDFTITRTVDAPRATVWKAFTEARHLAQWWGPAGFVMFKTSLDLRPGGSFHYGMRAPDGSEMWGKFVYREIEEPGRIVFVNMFSDPEGGTARAPFFDGAWPLEVLNEMTLTEQDGKTTITLRGGPTGATQAEIDLFHANHPSMRQGFGATFDQLDAYLRAAAL